MTPEDKIGIIRIMLHYAGTEIIGAQLTIDHTNLLASFESTFPRGPAPRLGYGDPSSIDLDEMYNRLQSSQSAPLGAPSGMLPDF